MPIGKSVFGLVFQTFCQINFDIFALDLFCENHQKQTEKDREQKQQ